MGLIVGGSEGSRHPGGAQDVQGARGAWRGFNILVVFMAFRLCGLKAERKENEEILRDLY